MNINYRKIILTTASLITAALMITFSGCSDKNLEEQEPVIYQTNYEDIAKASENIDCDVYIPEKSLDGYMITSISVLRESDLCITYESNSSKIIYTLSPNAPDSSNDDSFPSVEKKKINGINVKMKMVMDYPEPMYIIEYEMGNAYISVDCVNEANAEKIISTSKIVSEIADMNAAKGIIETEYSSVEELSQVVSMPISLPENIPNNYKPSRFYSINNLIGAVELSDGTNKITFAVSKNNTANNYFNDYSSDHKNYTQTVSGLIVPLTYSIIPNEKEEPVIYLASWGDMAENPTYNYILDVPVGMDEDSFSKLASEFYSSSINPIYLEMSEEIAKETETSESNEVETDEVSE